MRNSPLWLIATSTFLLACNPADQNVSTEALVEEARSVDDDGLRRGRGAGLDETRFHQDLVGFWRARTVSQGTFVDLIWVVGWEHAWHVVVAYADEAMQVPLLRWDLVRRYRLDDPSSAFPRAYDLTWNDQVGSLTPYVDAPALFAAVGVDDCALVPGERTDLSLDNCGAPVFPFRDCPLMDFVELEDGQMTFGDPLQGDRCLVRPTRYEAWSFDRVPLSAELLRALVGR